MAKINVNQIDELKSLLPPAVVFVTPSSETYLESIKRWSSSAERSAGLILYPLTSSDISLIAKFAVSYKLEIAICAGGHATSGSSSSDGGIVIDLSKMRKCVVDGDKKTVRVEGGALWKDVDVELGKYGLATVGGTVNHTGVGGLTLGGGYGWLSAQYGLVIDNLLEVEFVLADGSITTCSSTENEDLFWAARGAGQGFGVATSFVFQAYEQKNDVWAGSLIFPTPQLRAVIQANNELLAKGTGKSAGIVGCICPPPDLQPVVASIVFYNGPEEEAKEFFEPLLKLGPLVDMTKMMPYQELNGVLAGANPHGLRRTMKSSALQAPIDPSFAELIFADCLALKESNADLSSFGAFFEYFPSFKIIGVPQKATAFANRGAYQSVLYMPTWSLPGNDEKARKWARDMAAKTKVELKRMVALGTDKVTEEGVGEYANYDGVGEKGQVLYGVNYPRLVKLKKKYDPGNVFGKNLNLL